VGRSTRLDRRIDVACAQRGRHRAFARRLPTSVRGWPLVGTREVGREVIEALNEHQQHRLGSKLRDLCSCSECTREIVCLTCGFEPRQGSSVYASGRRKSRSHEIHRLARVQQLMQSHAGRAKVIRELAADGFRPWPRENKASARTGPQPPEPAPFEKAKRLPCDRPAHTVTLTQLAYGPQGATGRQITRGDVILDTACQLLREPRCRLAFAGARDIDAFRRVHTASIPQVRREAKAPVHDAPTCGSWPAFPAATRPSILATIFDTARDPQSIRVNAKTPTGGTG
jgi:hypothetical protein